MESFNYSDFEGCCSPICSDISPDPVLEAYRLARRAKKANQVEKPEETDDAQSELKPVDESIQVLQEPVVNPEENNNPMEIEQETGQTELDSVAETIQMLKEPVVNPEENVNPLETGQSSNAKEGEVQKKRRKRRKTSTDDDSWMPAGWIKIETCRKNGKTAGYTDKSYKAPGVSRAFRSKKQALEYIEKKEMAEAGRANEGLEDTIPKVQDGEGMQTPMAIDDQAIMSQSETSGIGGGDAGINANN